MTQRSNPLAGYFVAYDMSCNGDCSAGAVCTYRTDCGGARVFHRSWEAL